MNLHPPHVSRVVGSTVLVALLYVAGTMYVFNWQVDDACISMRYGKNLADGHGLVFNSGGDRIESYTSFLLLCTWGIRRDARRSHYISGAKNRDVIWLLAIVCG